MEYCEKLPHITLYLLLNVFPVVVNTFGTASDLIIAVLTFNRFMMLRSKIHNFNTISLHHTF